MQTPSSTVATPAAPEAVADDERDYYARNVRRYDSWFAAVYDALTWPARSLRVTVARVAGIHAGTRAIDVATGTAAQARAFADAGARVLAVDLSPRMLELASRKLRGRDIELVQADASDLPVESERFDVSCVSFALHEMPAGVRERVVRELARVTRRGGTVVIVDHALPRNRVWRWFVYHVVKAFEPATYVDFAHQDLAALLARSGIALRTTYRVGFGAVRILIGIREG